MSDFLSTGVSGLMAFQKALDTVSHNIANANTPGYSRQTASMVTNPAYPTGSGWLGSGVSVSTVGRSYDGFLAAQALDASASFHHLDTVGNLASSIDNLFADTNSGLSATLQKFSESVQTMANAPSQSASRQAVIGQAQALVSQFKSLEGSLAGLDSQVRTRLGSEAATISSMARDIATLNQKIMVAQASMQQPPNDLMDQRDQIISQLSGHVGVNTVARGDGSVDVYIGNGQTLVLGQTATALVATQDEFGSGLSRIAVQTTNGPIDVTNMLSGGAVGGLLQFQSQILVPSHNMLGQAAVTLVSQVNAQNAAGLDQNGSIGGALLKVGGLTALESGYNQGSAAVAGAISDLGSLTGGDATLRFDGTAWSLTDADSGASIALGASTSGGVTTLTGGGLTLAVSGTAQAGNRFLIRPLTQAVSGLALTTTDPTKIAAAGPVVTGATSGNTGTGSVDTGAVPDTAAWVRGNYTVQFTSASAWTVRDATNTVVGSGAYAPGGVIAFNGIRVVISGAPATGDTFAIRDNAAGTGDNSNALKLANILNQKVLDGGTQSLGELVGGYIGTIGLQTSQAQNGATAQQALLDSAQSAQQSVSGVNLDEEAANLVRLQQAYQAAAQVIKISDTLFQTLLNLQH